MADIERVPAYSAPQSTTQTPTPDSIFRYGALEVTVIILTQLLRLIIFPILLPALVYQVYRYEKGIYFRFGRFIAVAHSGLGIRLPFIDIVQKVDLRTNVIDLVPQECITKDSVSITVNGVVFYRVRSAEKATINVANYHYASSNIAQTTMRQVIGEYELEELISRREQINQKLQKIIDDRTEEWGVCVEAVELKDITLPQSMVRAMASQAEAEREKRAKIITAEGEKLASQKLKEAADVLSGNSASLRIRALQTLQEISTEKHSTIIFPIPIDFPFIDKN